MHYHHLIEYDGGLAVAAHFHESIPINEWIASLAGISLGSNAPSSELYDYLLRQGQSYADILGKMPNDVPEPIIVRPYDCHNNVWNYARHIIRSAPHAATHLKIVSGMYGMRSTKNIPYPYFISEHTFLLYGEQVFDCTAMRYSPADYHIDQYYGVAYPLETVVEKMAPLMEKRSGAPRKMASMLQLMHQTFSR